MKTELFGQTRTVVRDRYALLTPDGFVPSVVPGWESSECTIAIAGGLGARFSQWFACMPEDATGHILPSGRSTFLYVLQGSLTTGEQDLHTGGFAYLPPQTDLVLTSTAPETRLLVFEKPYEALDGVAAPAPICGHAPDIKGEPFLGHEDARLQTLLPDDIAFDMAVNIFVYDPGATLPFVETHIMEHGMMILAGQGVYRINEDYHPVCEGDVIWMAPWCPQWYVSMGRESSSYIYYKDVNRHPLPADV